MYEFIKKMLLPFLKVEVTRPEPLPGHQGEVLQIIRACPAYLQYKLFFWKLYLIAWTSGVIVGSLVLVLLKTWFLIFAIPLVILAAIKAAILYVAIRLDYDVRWYIITEQSLLIRQGAWVIREICLTYVNAQNVLVLQGPMQRIFGFSNVVVDTAGGGSGEEDGTQSHRAVLRGLDKPGEIRDLILSLLKRHRTGGLGDPDDLPEAAGPTDLDGGLYEIWQETKILRQVVEKRLLTYS